MRVMHITSTQKKIVVSDNEGVSFCVANPVVTCITVGNRTVIVANQGITGPPGTPGADAPGATVDYPAGENLSAGRVVIIDGGEAFYFQPLDNSHIGRAYAVTTTSATIGNDVTLQQVGEVVDMSFGFAVDSILWVDDDGEVVSTQPTGKVTIQKAGISSGLNKMKIDFSVTIKLQ